MCSMSVHTICAYLVCHIAEKSQVPINEVSMGWQLYSDKKKKGGGDARLSKS